MDGGSMANKHTILLILLIIRGIQIIDHKEIPPDTSQNDYQIIIKKILNQ